MLLLMCRQLHKRTLISNSYQKEKLSLESRVLIRNPNRREVVHRTDQFSPVTPDFLLPQGCQALLIPLIIRGLTLHPLPPSRRVPHPIVADLSLQRRIQFQLPTFLFRTCCLMEKGRILPQTRALSNTSSLVHRRAFLPPPQTSFAMRYRG